MSDNIKEEGLATEITRRDFLKGTGATLVAGTVVPVLTGTTAQAAESAQVPDVPRSTISITVNGTAHTVEVEDRWTLVELLRDHLQLTGTKIGCNRSECGACTVLMNGAPVYSCSQLAVWADGTAIQTVEGLAVDGALSPLQEAFVNHNGPQCGFCTPGQLMTATALLAVNPNPSAAQVRTALVGNLCRCANYTAIVEAVVIAGGGSVSSTVTGGAA